MTLWNLEEVEEVDSCKRPSDARQAVQFRMHDGLAMVDAFLHHGRPNACMHTREKH